MEKVKNDFYNKLLIKILIVLGTLIILFQASMKLGMNINDVSFDFQKFRIIFMSIIIEAIPFIMIGVLISSIIEVFISKENMQKCIPKNKILALIVACLIGIFIPICDCGVIPVARRFMKKGVPFDVSITFLLAAPIVNPVSIFATYYAFSDRPYVVFLRIGLGLFVAFTTGLTIGQFEKGTNPLKKETTELKVQKHKNNYKAFSGNISKANRVESDKEKNKYYKVNKIIDHTTAEFFSVGKYIVLGAFISALMQTFINRNNFLTCGKDPVTSVIFMIVLAFILSICSTADAFIARTFVGQFTMGSVVTFLTFGPMLDTKNILMLKDTFENKFLIKLVILIISYNFLIGVLVNSMH